MKKLKNIPKATVLRPTQPVPHKDSQSWSPTKNSRYHLTHLNLDAEDETTHMPFHISIWHAWGWAVLHKDKASWSYHRINKGWVDIQKPSNDDWELNSTVLTVAFWRTWIGWSYLKIAGSAHFCVTFFIACVEAPIFSAVRHHSSDCPPLFLFVLFFWGAWPKMYDFREKQCPAHSLDSFPNSPSSKP